MPENSTKKTDYDWKRSWIEPSLSQDFGTKGFFSRWVADLSQSDPEPRTLSDLRDVDGLILRGPSGSGKTTAMRKEMDDLATKHGTAHWIQLADHSSVPTAELDAATTRDGSVVFLDGADVAVISQPALFDELGRTISHLRGDRRFSVRVTVRSGVRCDALAQFFQDAFNDVRELALAPLSAADVRVAARVERIDSDDFLSYVGAIRASPLATQPPTLRMLFALWQRNGDQPRGAALPIRREVLYRDGCHELVRETEINRLRRGGGDQAQFVGRLNVEERMAIAARVAALMVFCDRSVLDLADGASGASAGHVEAFALGAERTSSGPLAVRRESIREVTRTGLFRSDGDDRYTFAHPSFMDFLAASFVVRRGLSDAQVLSLVRASTTGRDVRIAGNRIDVASWLAAMSPRLFDILVATDPQVLLRSGIPPRSAAERMKLAEALLRASGDGYLDLEEIEQSGDLVLVSNPSLSARVGAVMRDRACPMKQRLFAAMLAEQCGGITGVARDFLSVASDADEPFDLRWRALNALRFAPIEERRDAIVELARHGTNGDDGRRLQGLALRLVYPRLAGAGEVIRMLTPFHASEYDSIYEKFNLILFRELQAAELPDALAAVAELARRRYTKRDNLRNLAGVASVVGKRAFAHLHHPATRDGLAEMILAIPDDLAWAGWTDTLHNRGMPEEATDLLRRDLIEAVARLASGSAIAKVLLEFPHLVRDEDLEWLATAAAALPEGTPRIVVCTLAAEVARTSGGTSAFSVLRNVGLDAAAADGIVLTAVEMAPDFSRWTPPRHGVEEPDEPEAAPPEEGQGLDDEDSLLDSIADVRLLHLQRSGSGRPPAPVIDPGSFLALLEQAERRLVRDDRELLVVVLESLDRLQQRLKGATPLVRGLWNEEKDAAHPKDESVLSDVVADHLRMDLGFRAIVADREVEIRPRIATTKGQRTDIRVQAFNADRSRLGRSRVASLTIEIKGCWNPDLHTSMKEQLRDRYMATTDENTGLYLVGWYVCPSWRGAEVAGRVARKSGALPAARKKLARQASTLSTNGQIVDVYLLDATLA
ncbi:NACHT domain-containing protein [Methylobacterium sp. 391_Methyba4]|uniref:NACHT domain-containing protein n=1 Tax=Methylobacterium sp. 391_Methyba4 TaxID=3038924 RepID=UPI00241EB5BE|nr:hypothetical protein [Methylobacterium sp. 391_Methyba4]WFS09705.1 hypothetical protein P9K36_10690 [Methylobacterium sp. 391_Methyba4]